MGVGANPLTIVTRINPADFDGLNSLLTRIGDHPNGDEYLNLPSIGSLRTAAFVVIAGEARYRPALVLDINYEGELEAHLQELSTRARAGLDAIYRKCEGYGGGGSPAQIRSYLRKHSVRQSAYFAAFADHTLESIRNAVAVREEAERFLGREQSARRLRGLAPVAIFARIKRHFESDSTPVRPKASALPPARRQQIDNFNRIVIGAASAGIALTYWPLSALWLLAIRMRELGEPSIPAPPPKAGRRLLGGNRLRIQNHLALAGIVKPGLLTQWTLKLVLGAIDLTWKGLLRNAGSGDGLAVHFARALLLDEGGRLMMSVCHDGSPASLLDGLAEKAAYYLNAMCGNVEGFPACRWLLFGGSEDRARYAAWTRQSTQYTPLFYSAYPDDTVENLLKDIELRDALAGSLSAAEAERLLKMLQPRLPESTIDDVGRHPAAAEEKGFSGLSYALLDRISKWSDALLDQMLHEGDPPADDAVSELFASGQRQALFDLIDKPARNDRLLVAGMPPALARYFERTSQTALPGLPRISLGERLLSAHGPEIITILACYSVPGEYASLRGAQVFRRAGYLNPPPNRRLLEIAQMAVDVLSPGGLRPGGKAIRAAQRVRLMHAAVRRLILDDQRNHWDRQSLGVPINQEDLLGTLMNISWLVVDGLRKLQIDLDGEAAETWLDIWRAVGVLMGIDRELMPGNLDEARELTAIVARRQQGPSLEASEMTGALISAARSGTPAVFARLPAALMRLCLAPQVADWLNVPSGRTLEEAEAEIFMELGDEFDHVGPESRHTYLCRRFGLEVVDWLLRTEAWGKRARFELAPALRADWGLAEPEALVGS